jgi:hypothetical protein
VSHDSEVGGAPDAATCAAEASECLGAVLLTCADGWLQPARTCPVLCDDELGCVECEPGTASCAGGSRSLVCGDDGVLREQECDGLCDFETGRCDASCAPENLGSSYLGCDYYPTQTGNLVRDRFAFAAVVANAANAPARVTISGGALTSERVFTIVPGEVHAELLPWVPLLKACTYMGQSECSTTQPAALVERGAYRLRSSRPVTVYQFSPLEYQMPGEDCVGCVDHSHSNDASLLLPANALGKSYVVAAWPAWIAPKTGTHYPSLLAVTATEPDTLVTVTTTATTQAGWGAPGFVAGVPQTVTLHRGDVLQLFAYDGDLTGSWVSADRPVQVIGGHYCTNVPLDTPYCDHLEETLLPVQALGAKYVVTPAAVPTMPDGKAQAVRIVAAEAGGELVFDPPQQGVPTSIASAGGMIEIPLTSASFLVEASGKVLVAQYMAGQELGGNMGDPAMAQAVPVQQFRKEYLLLAPLTYDTSFVAVTAPLGATVVVDGEPVPAASLVPVGDSGYGVAHVVLGEATGGNHTMTGDQPFGISIYGYGMYTSYWTPGGLDLLPIVVD